MNIQDVEIEFVIPDGDVEKIKRIFERQCELMEKYHPIEKRNGFHVGECIPLNLDSKFDQHRIKDFSWRIMEEVAEHLEAWENGDPEHSVEEIIDGLHFLVELMIISGAEVPTSFFGKQTGDLNRAYLRFIMHLGCAMNCLKNKPWKQTHMMTDREYFYSKIKLAWRWYCVIMSENGLTPDDIFTIYFRKSEVNKFRQRSNY